MNPAEFYSFCSSLLLNTQKNHRVYIHVFFFGLPQLLIRKVTKPPTLLSFSLVFLATILLFIPNVVPTFFDFHFPYFFLATAPQPPLPYNFLHNNSHIQYRTVLMQLCLYICTNSKSKSSVRGC